MEAGDGDSGRCGRSLRTRRYCDAASILSSNHRGLSSNHGAKNSCRRERRFNLLKVSGNERSVKVFLVRMEAVHVERSWVIGGISGNGSSNGFEDGSVFLFEVLAISC